MGEENKKPYVRCTVCYCLVFFYAGPAVPGTFSFSLFVAQLSDCRFVLVGERCMDLLIVQERELEWTGLDWNSTGLGLKLISSAGGKTRRKENDGMRHGKRKKGGKSHGPGSSTASYRSSVFLPKA